MLLGSKLTIWAAILHELIMSLPKDVHYGDFRSFRSFGMTFSHFKMIANTGILSWRATIFSLDQWSSASILPFIGASAQSR